VTQGVGLAGESLEPQEREGVLLTATRGLGRPEDVDLGIPAVTHPVDPPYRSAEVVEVTVQVLAVKVDADRDGLLAGECGGNDREQPDQGTPMPLTHDPPQRGTLTELQAQS
jgi:hypothetical protein